MNDANDSTRRHGPHQDRSGEPEIPDELARDLAGLFARRPEVPPAIDACILARARTLCAARGNRIRWWLRAAASVAAAAALAGVIVLAAQRSGTRPQAPVSVAVPEDLDGNGNVTIVDALLLARRIEEHAPFQGAWDINRDGAVDRADVDAIAMRAVRITGG